MSASTNMGKVFVVDSNLFFVKRLAEALKQNGFEAIHCSDAAYALTMIERNMPVAILCATQTSGSISFEIPAILRTDASTCHIPVVAIGDRGKQSQLEALRAGYADFIDRRLGADEIASHLVSLLTSHADGFQPTQMLSRAETALDGRLSLVDLPGVIQMIEQSRQTGGLHVNASATDGIIFFNSGVVIHAESGLFAGDDAIVHLIKRCHNTKEGVYKFIPGSAPSLRTVHCNLNGLIMDALRELDEEERDSALERESRLDSSQLREDADSLDEVVSSPENATHESIVGNESQPLETEESLPHEIENQNFQATDEPLIEAASLEECIPLQSEDHLRDETVAEESADPMLCVFDSASVDLALNSLDGQFFELELGKEETHE